MADIRMICLRKNVLRYCKDGNFQAMVDEYRHLISNLLVSSMKGQEEVILL